jgi:YhcH/YjgK/YiaL family protein
MILDSIDHANSYTGLGPGFAKVFHFLQTSDIATRPVGRYELDGDRLFMIIQEYDTRLRADGLWEAHRRYIDLQHVLAGVELMGRADTASLQVRKPYDEASDVGIFDGEGDFVRVGAGEFTVFFPHDAHMPCLAAPDPAPVRKVVFKIDIG